MKSSPSRLARIALLLGALSVSSSCTPTPAPVSEESWLPVDPVLHQEFELQRAKKRQEDAAAEQEEKTWMLGRWSDSSFTMEVRADRTWQLFMGGRLFRDGEWTSTDTGTVRCARAIVNEDGTPGEERWSFSRVLAESAEGEILTTYEKDEAFLSGSEMPNTRQLKKE